MSKGKKKVKKSKCRVFVTIRKTGFPEGIISFSEFL